MDKEHRKDVMKDIEECIEKINEYFYDTRDIRDGVLRSFSMAWMWLEEDKGSLVLKSTIINESVVCYGKPKQILAFLTGFLYGIDSKKKRNFTMTKYY